MNKKRLVVLAFIGILLMVFCLSCTDQQQTRSFGGKMTINLKRGQKLVMATWKTGDNLWYLTRPMRPGETPENYEFTESASFGFLEGTVFFKESQ